MLLRYVTLNQTRKKQSIQGNYISHIIAHFLANAVSIIISGVSSKK